jgi:hypothetical protein
MKCTSATDWMVGDKGKIPDGRIVFVEAIIGNRYLKIVDTGIVEKKIYIPAHGEIEKV